MLYSPYFYRDRPVGPRPADLVGTSAVDSSCVVGFPEKHRIIPREAHHVEPVSISMKFQWRDMKRHAVPRWGYITALIIKQRSRDLPAQKYATNRVREFRQVRYAFLTSDYSSGGRAVAYNGSCRVPGFSSFVVRLRALYYSL